MERGAEEGGTCALMRLCNVCLCGTYTCLGIHDRFVNVAVWLITSVHNVFFCSAPSSTSSPLSFSPLLLTEPLCHSKVQNANQLATTCSNARTSPTPIISQATPFQIPLCPTKSKTRTWNLIRMKRKRTKKKNRKNPPSHLTP